jgi:hypothetical protein
VITATGKGTVQASCPAGTPHAISGGGAPNPEVELALPTHGAGLAKSGQSATGWRADATKRSEKLTVYVICAP